MDTHKSIIKELYDVITDRRQNPVEGSYTNYLFSKGSEKICKKIGEEATEAVISATMNKREDLVSEIADLTYHMLVLMAEKGITPEEIETELQSRR